MAPIGAEKSRTEIYNGMTENVQIKEVISIMWLFCNTIQLITIKLCTKFQNPKSSSLREIFDRKCPNVLYKSDRMKKIKIQKRRQNKDKHLYFHLHNTLCLPEGVHKI